MIGPNNPDTPRALSRIARMRIAFRRGRPLVSGAIPFS
jgi:hypothetical protein